MDITKISSFDRDDMSLSARRRRAAGENRTGRGARPRRAKPRHGDPAPSMAPTPERLAKPDAPVHLAPGHYVVEDRLERLRSDTRALDPTKAQAVLERLHHRCALDHDPGMNEQMFNAGKKYEVLVHVAGLGGIGAQNLAAAPGSGDAAHMIPTSEGAARARLALRGAWTIMGTKVSAAVHALLVDGTDAESVGRETSSYQSQKECRTAAMTTLRIGLWMLVNARWA